MNTLSPVEAADPVSVSSPKLATGTFGMLTPVALFCTQPPSAACQPLPAGQRIEPLKLAGTSQSWMNNWALPVPGGFSKTNCDQPAQLLSPLHAAVEKTAEFICSV